MTRAPSTWMATPERYEAAGGPISPVERTGHDLSLTVTRTVLNEATFSQCWEAGRALSLEQAVDKALTEVGMLGC